MTDTTEIFKIKYYKQIDGNKFEKLKYTFLEKNKNAKTHKKNQEIWIDQ